MFTVLGQRYSCWQMLLLVCIFFGSSTLLGLTAGMSLPFSFHGKPKPCLEDVEQASFQTAQTSCIEVTVTSVLKASETTAADDTDETQTSLDLKLLLYYSDPAIKEFEDKAVLDNFENCFKNKTAELLSIKRKKFDKMYSRDLRASLIKSNKKDCQPTIEDAQSQANLDKAKEKWNKQSFFLRPLRKAAAKMVAIFDSDYVECFSGVMNDTVPTILCGNSTERVQIIAKCLKAHLTEKNQIDDAAGTAPPPKPKKLSRFSKYIIDKFICGNKRPKRSSQGGRRILARWPVFAIVGVIGLPFMMWGAMILGGWDSVFYFGTCLGLVFGSVVFAITLVGAILYVLFGVPWRAISQFRSNDTSADYFDSSDVWDEAKELASKTRKQVESTLDKAWGL